MGYQVLALITRELNSFPPSANYTINNLIKYSYLTLPAPSCRAVVKGRTKRSRRTATERAPL